MKLRVTDIVDHRALLLSVAVLAPLLIVSVVTGDTASARGGVVAMSALIASERSGLAPVGVAAQGLVIVAGVALILTAAPHPPLLAASVAALACGCFVVTARGQRLRSLASFTFIPILYVGFELHEGADGANGPMLRSVAAVTALAIAPVILVAAIRHHRGRSGGYVRHMTRLMRWSDHGPRESVGAALIALMMGTAVAVQLASWLHLHHGQWAVWSAVSVISAGAALRKLGDRAVGALIGVPLGIGAGLVMPGSQSVVEAAVLVGLLTLTAIRPYRLAFATRCGCVALALIASHHSDLAAAERVEGVLLGGVIGLAAFGLATLFWLRGDSGTANAPRIAYVAPPGRARANCAVNPSSPFSSSSSSPPPYNGATLCLIPLPRIRTHHCAPLPASAVPCSSPVSQCARRATV